MTSRTLFRAAVVVALLSATAMPVLADATHNHPAANGTAAAPLDIVRAATDLAQPVGARGPETIKVKLDTVEVTGSLADGATYHTGPSTGRFQAPSSEQESATPSKLN